MGSNPPPDTIVGGATSPAEAGEPFSRVSLDRALAALRGYAWELDLRTAQVWTSDTTSLSGYERQAFGKSWAEFEAFVHPDDWPRLNRALRDHLKGLTPTIECEYRLTTPGGGWIWVLDQGCAVERSPDGRAQRLIGFRLDITARKESEERQRLAQEAGGVGLYEIDMTDGSSVGNSVFLSFYGLPPDHGRMSFEHWVSRIHEDDRRRVIEHVRGVLKRKATEVIEYRVVRDDGSVIWTSSRTRHDEDASGRYRRAWGVQRDITEQKLAELALAAREAELSTIYGQALVGICYRAIDGRLISANRRYCEIVGRTLSELHHTGWRELAHPDDVRVIDSLYATRSSPGDPIQAEVRCIRPDGGEVWCRSHMSYVLDDNGVAQSVIIVLDDISELKRAQAEEHVLHERLDKAARLVTAGAMGATLSHELQQPHAAVVNYLAAAKVLLERSGCAPEALKAVEAAERESLRAGDIVRHMRDFVALGAARTKPDDLLDLISELLEVMPMAPDTHARLKLCIEDGARSVEVDRVQVQQVLTNLIKNALEASGDHGEVSIEAAAGPAGHVTVAVSDSGPGFPDTVSPNLFELFSTTKSEGLGLGLGIAKTIVEAHGGRIWHERPRGRTRVCFTLPAPE